MSLCGAPNKAYVSSDRHQSLPMLQGETQGNTKPNEGTQVNQGTNRQGRFQFLHIESEHNEDTQNKTKDQRTYTYYQD